MKYQMRKAPMGWNSYDYYDTTVNEEQVKANAEYMASHLKEAGWEYIVVDIEWYAKGAGSMRELYQYIPFAEVQMDGYGRLQPDEERFPSSANGKGFGPLADDIHRLGLKFGIHIMRGIPRTAAHQHLPVWGMDVTADQIADPSSICGWNPDMYGIRKNVKGAQEYYDSIIRMYAEWGVDYIKCDDICNTNLYRENQYSAAHEVEMIQSAIQKTGRDIVLSLSPGPALIEKAWHYEKYANMWRITDDFWDKWDALYDMFSRAEKWCTHSGAGHWPDADMLPIGPIRQDYDKSDCTKFTQDEQVTMLTLWSIFRSPLMIGGEMTKFDDFTMGLVTNKEILKMHKNSRNPHQVWRKEINGTEHILWTSTDCESGVYIAIFNTGGSDSNITLNFEDVEINTADVLELWSGEEIAKSVSSIDVKLPSHGAKAYHLEY